MKLYLHIGTEKTGSSYLQTLAAMNRDILLKNGVWFPTAGKRERQLLAGEISAGNAQPLADALNKKQGQLVNALVKEWKKEAEERACKACLLSNELLLLAVSKPSTLRFLVDLIRQEFQSTSVLLMLRDPVDQALSLFKHRAKSGTAPDIEQWPQTSYYYGEALKSFFSSMEETEIQLNCRKYGKQGGYLEKIFFKDWLGIENKLEKPDKRVNPSLSISELLLIKQLRQKSQWLPYFLYAKLQTIPACEKAKETRLTEYYKAILSKHLAQYHEVWNQCNQYLPDGEKLKPPEQNTEKFSKEDKEMTFSEMQGRVLTEFIRDATQPTFKIRLQIRKWRSQLGKLKTQLINKN